MNKKRIITHFQYLWWIYIALAVALILIWINVFERLAKPKDNEQLNITICASFDKDALENELGENLYGKTNRELKEVNVESIAGFEGYALYELLAMRCVGNTDFVILQESDLSTTVTSLFVPLETEKMISYIGNAQTYLINGTVFGICVYDGQSQNNFSKFYKGTETCWLFITAVSKNVDRINGNGEDGDNSALLAISYLLEK